MTINISVRNLVEFVFKSGDINSTYTSSKRAVEGTVIHQKIQSKRKKQAKLNGTVYESEVSLKTSFCYGDFDFHLDGRADGISFENDKITIEEIKSTKRNLPDITVSEVHLAQAKCYAYMYMQLNSTSEINVLLTYCTVEEEEELFFHYFFTEAELSLYFFDVIHTYCEWLKIMKSIAEKRDLSIKATNFPYENYRKGQREAAVAIYKTIQANKKIFIKAPTGTGKTISTLFPSIKALGEGLCSKIFYITSKTITRQVAEDTLNFMIQKGLYVSFVTLTAKDKICFTPQGACTPEKCPFAKGHFDRVNEALKDILLHVKAITRAEVEQYAIKHHICPFEFSFDIAEFSDCIIGDYNYVFDPKVQLKRFFQEESSNDFVLLIDEAHNLVDRAREMFSASLDKTSFMQLKKPLKSTAKKLYKSMDKINKFFMGQLAEIKQSDYVDSAIVKHTEPTELYHHLHDFVKEADSWLVMNEGQAIYEDVIDLYFQVLDFLRIAELFDENYVQYIEYDKNNIMIKLLCINPSFLLSQTEKKVKTSVFFSATLSPLSYFINILGGNADDYAFKIPSPFDRNNLCLMIENTISTKYKDRENSYEKICDYIYAAATSKKGNYFIFFPSFEYMNKVYTFFSEKYGDVTVILQQQMMPEEEREKFLLHFSADGHNKESLLGFVVMGGIFSEGIDLVGERLIGAIIVGVGLPQISKERNIYSDFFQRQNGLGFEYAYVYPAMNKVLQSAGRVIRSETDRGVILLIDSRFLHSTYKGLFPEEWDNYMKINTVTSFKHIVDKFW